MQKTFNWSKAATIVAGIGLIATIAVPMIEDKPVAPLSEEALQTAIDTGVTEILTENGIIGEDNVLDTIANTTGDTNAELLEEDIFETSVELMAKDETDSRGFMRDLAEELGLDRSDYKDITKIQYRDIDTDAIDVDDGDATVTMELRVTYDSDDEDDERDTVEVVFDIEDNEIEDITITLD